MYLQVGPEVFELIQLQCLLGLCNDVRPKTMHPFGLLTKSSKIAYIDLHVRQRNEHVLCDGCVLTEVEPLLILCTTVKAEERIPIVSRGENGDIF